jgi:MFS family permease
MNSPAPSLTLTRVVLCGALIAAMSLGVRHGFGLWLQPITEANNWTRETYSLAIAIQNIMWGVVGIFTGMLADRFGAYRVLLGGAVCYALGLAGMASASSVWLFMLSTGGLIGAAQGATTFSVIYGIIGRNIAPEKRSWAMGMTASAGSFGQFLMVPLESQLILNIGPANALYVLALVMLIILPLGLAVRERQFGSGPVVREQTIAQATREAAGYRSFQWLTLGYFVCGFQVVFIGIHMPSYLKDEGLAPEVAGYALALIGLFNVVGTYVAGSLGQRFARRYILASIYALRALAITVFLLVPLTPASVYVFSAVMGALWLSTVPPTNAIVVHMFGVQHFTMLSGMVFFSHQLGSFLGVWLGGRLYDTWGSYDGVWVLTIVLGVASALVNLLVREEPVQRQPPHGMVAA